VDNEETRKLKLNSQEVRTHSAPRPVKFTLLHENP